MRFNLTQEDPLAILSSTKPIVESLEYVEIHDTALTKMSVVIEEKLQKGLDIAENHFGIGEDLVDAIQLIFLEDVVNFCFWAKKDTPKWQVAWPEGSAAAGGWYSLTKCFMRAIAEGVPILDANYLGGITTDQGEKFFRGCTGVPIPLFSERVENLREAGKVLKTKYDGKFVNVLEEANYDAIQIVNTICKNFPSFRDNVVYKGEKIYFLKRAQICAQDFSYLSKKHKDLTIKNVGLLTAFADYKVPQMLRKYGGISYKKKLAYAIDTYTLIPMGSRQEVEIRSATIWCIELLRQKLKKYTAAQIDNALWLVSQDQTDVKPYHRTYTIFY